MSGNKTENAAMAWGQMLPNFLNPAAMMNPFAAMPGVGSNSVDPGAWMKAIDPKEIERRIAELKVVEMWLQSQVSLVQMSIQTLTMQKQSFEALHAAAQATAQVTASPLNFSTAATEVKPEKTKRRK